MGYITLYFVYLYFYIKNNIGTYANVTQKVGKSLCLEKLKKPLNRLPCSFTAGLLSEVRVNAENQQRVKCGKVCAGRSAFYSLLIFCIPLSAEDGIYQESW